MIHFLGNRSNLRQNMQNQKGVSGRNGLGDFSAVLESSKNQTNRSGNNRVRTDSIMFQSAQKQVETDRTRPTDKLETAQTAGSYQERLEQIHKQNAETDWASMSDVDKVRTFEERYRKAFGSEKLFIAGVLYSNHRSEDKNIYDDYIEQTRLFFGKGQPAEMEKSYGQCYKEIYYGERTDEEVRASIRERWLGSGTLEDKYLMLAESVRCGVDVGVEVRLMREIEFNIVYAPTENRGTGGGAVSWKQLVESRMLAYESAIDMSTHKKAYTAEQLKELRNEFDEFLKSLGEEK